MNVVLPSSWRRSSSASDTEKVMPSDVFVQWLIRTFPSITEGSLGLTPERAVSLSRQFSLLMVGVIVLSSVRLVLRGVNRVSRRGMDGELLRIVNCLTQALRMTRRSLGASFMLLILGQLMVRFPSLPFPAFLTPCTRVLNRTSQGTYLLSTLIQLRSSFPPPSSAGLSLFSTLPPFEVFGLLFDTSFLVSAGVSAVVRWLQGMYDSDSGWEMID